MQHPFRHCLSRAAHEVDAIFHGSSQGKFRHAVKDCGAASNHKLGPIVEQREPIVLNQIVVAPELCDIVAAFVRASDEQLAMHLVYVETIRINCEPIVKVGICAATATIECQMVRRYARRSTSRRRILPALDRRRGWLRQTGRQALSRRKPHVSFCLPARQCGGVSGNTSG